MTAVEIGVIGGSGLYALEDLEGPHEHALGTPFGAPSDVVVTGEIRGVQVAFLARHGRGHRLLPSEVPYRANVYALKRLGVRYLIAVSAVGSLREDVRPLDMVLPDQFVDLTKRREQTFFGEGAVAHVSMGQPTCERLAAVLADSFAATQLGDIRLHRTGTYVCIEGPAFSTRAESEWYRGLGASVVGMTNMPEAKIAREAEIAYASLALVTDYDSWRLREPSVTAELAIANLKRNSANARQVLFEAIRRIAANPPRSEAHTALRAALVTQPGDMSAASLGRLGVLLGRR